MDELFGSVIYLIPIALIIFRVLSSITANMKKNAQQAAGENGDQARQTQTDRQAPANPARQTPAGQTRRLPAEGRPQDPAARQTARPAAPSAARPTSSGAVPDKVMQEIIRRFAPETANLPHWEREKQTPPRPKPAAAKVPPNFKAPVKTEINVLDLPIKPRPEPEAQKQAARAPAAPLSFPAKLSPLQQGFVWAELLGTPKGFD